MKEELSSINPKKLAELEKTMDLFAETAADEEPVWADGKTIDEVAFCEEQPCSTPDEMHPRDPL